MRFALAAFGVALLLTAVAVLADPWTIFLLPLLLLLALVVAVGVYAINKTLDADD